MAESLEVSQQKKVLRTLLRLKHSLAADREIHAVLQEMAQVGQAGSVPQLEATLAEVLGTEAS